MKLAVVATLLLAACGGPQAKPESPLVNEGSDTPETCCCKSFPLTSEDGKPIFEMAPRMECSAKQGTCVGDAQCHGSEAPPAPAPSPGGAATGSDR